MHGTHVCLGVAGLSHEVLPPCCRWEGRRLFAWLRLLSVGPALNCKQHVALVPHHVSASVYTTCALRKPCRALCLPRYFMFRRFWLWHSLSVPHLYTILLPIGYDIYELANWLPWLRGGSRSSSRVLVFVASRNRRLNRPAVYPCKVTLKKWPVKVKAGA